MRGGPPIGNFEFRRQWESIGPANEVNGILIAYFCINFIYTTIAQGSSSGYIRK